MRNKTVLYCDCSQSISKQHLLSFIIMGTVFGKQSVAEPAFEVVLSRSNNAGLAYEIRRYGTRFAAQVECPSSSSSSEDDSTPFRLLAKYIGVFGNPENEGQMPVSMTAPVVKKEGETNGAVPISMTAPVVKAAKDNNNNDDSTSVRIMQFILPAEYTSLDQIPKPTNPAVSIHTIPPAVGAVHRYSGSFDDNRSLAMAHDLAQQLATDGVTVGDSAWVASHYQFWGTTIIHYYFRLL